MAIRKVISAKKPPVKKVASNKAPLKKARIAKGKVSKKPIQNKPRVAKACVVKKKLRKAVSSEMDAARQSLTHALVQKSTGKKGVSPKYMTPKKPTRITKCEKKTRMFDSNRVAGHVEFVDGSESALSVEALKIGLLLAAIDGNCDKNEIKKFKTVAKSCGGLSDAKIDQIVTQMQRRISVLEDAAKHGASDEELVDTFMAEACNIGVRAECRNFVLWMSIAMVDGDYSGVEQKAITALQRHANRYHTLLSFPGVRGHEISDMFLKRCQMILSGIYKSDSAGDKRIMKNRMKSLQTLIEIAEA